MSVPSRKPLPAQNFFGKSYPRAIGALTGDDKLVVGDNRPQLPNASFLKWAGTADWRRGGTGSHWVGKAPKEPITPYEAYEMYLDSQAAKAAAETAQKDGKKQEPDDNKEVAVVPEDAQRSWEVLSTGERAIFEDLARDDAKRFQEAATAFEMANPGWFERRHKWKQQPRRAPGAKRAGPKRSAKPGPKRPRPALTPWKAFLKVILEKVKQRDPEAAASLKAAELLQLATEQAGPIWEKMADADKAEYISMATEDEARYERELEAYTTAQAGAEQRAADTGSRGSSASKDCKPRSRKNKASKAVADGAKPEGASRRKQGRPVKADKAAVAKEAAEKVDVTGLTPMQAWAEKQRAMRQAGAAPKRAKRATRRASAARKELVEEAAAPPAPPAVARHAATAGNGGTLMNERGTAATAQPQPRRAQESELPGQAPPAEAHACGGATLDDLDDSSEEEVAEAADDDVSISSSSSSEPDHAEEEEEEAGSEDLTGDVLDLARDEGPSQVPDTQPRASQDKEPAEVGMLGRMRSALADGLGWLTSGRKRRGVMASMQDEALEQRTAERPGRAAGPGTGSPATAAKKRATPRRLERSLTDFDKITFDEAPSSAAKRRRVAK